VLTSATRVLDAAHVQGILPWGAGTDGPVALELQQQAELRLATAEVAAARKPKWIFVLSLRLVVAVEVLIDMRLAVPPPEGGASTPGPHDQADADAFTPHLDKRVLEILHPLAGDDDVSFE